MRRPIAVDLFAGVGGMALGFEQAGFDVVAAVERDPAHAGAHRFNFPRCEVLEVDAARLRAEALTEAVRTGLRSHGRSAPLRPRVDVVFGGPPCQGFSVGGRLDPNDPRNQLIREFVRLVEALRPTAFVLENVPAMASRTLPGTRLAVPEWLRSRLRPAGYEIADGRVLNASHFGVPQDRRRLLIVGVLGGGVSPILPPAMTAAVPRRPGAALRRGDTGHPRTSPELPNGPTVADAIGDLPDIERFDELLHDDAVCLTEDALTLTRALRSSYAARLARDEVDPQDLAAPRRWDPQLLTSSLRTVHADEIRERFMRTPQGEPEAVSRLYRLHPDGLSRTLRAGSGPDRGSYSAPRPIHPHYARVISVREAARLHGFPDWFRFSAAKWHGFRQVGNSVPPPMARAVAAAVRDALSLPTVVAGNPVALGWSGLLRVANGGGRVRSAPARTVPR